MQHGVIMTMVVVRSAPPLSPMRGLLSVLSILLLTTTVGTNKNNFQKTIDKTLVLWYNKYRKKERGEQTYEEKNSKDNH